MTLPSQSRANHLASEPNATEEYLVPQLGSPLDAPPAYGAHHDQFQFSQPGFEAGAVVTKDGRVDISINTKNRRLTDLLAPTLNSQISVEPQPAPPYAPPGLAPEPGSDRLPPPLNIVIQIVGSRGDIQPFVALGKVLKNDYGHRVRIATHSTFQQFVEENELEFFSIGGDPAELMAFMVKHPGLMPGMDALKSGEITRRRRGIQEMLVGCWRSCIETGNGSGPPLKPHARNEPLDPTFSLPDDGTHDPFIADAIIANPPSFAHIHIAEKLGIPLHMMFTMPWSPTRAFPHPLANIKFSNVDEVVTNNLTYTLVEMMTWHGLGDVINRFREKVLDLPSLSFIWAPGLLTRLKVPYTYCWSPALIPKPNDWGKHVDISGFFFLDLASSYTPDLALSAFLQAGPPPVYIGFGSIVVEDPNALTRMIFDAIHLSGVRALVSKGWGGLGVDDVGVPDGAFMLGNVPHDWLFQHVSAVIHHGGAGTTAAGIKAGKPTFVVPFFGDQPFWGAMIAKAKAGPEPIRYKDLTAEKLAEAIRFCLKSETQQQAKDLGAKIRQEQGTKAGGMSFHKHLDVESLRCSLVPRKAAAWRVRRSKVRLSPLAAAVLVDQGLLQYTDMKLYRPYEYNTEDQPPDPITAGACSLVGDISTIGMAIADMPRQIVKSGQRGKDGQSSPVPPRKDSNQQTTAASDDTMRKGSSTDPSSITSPPTQAAKDGTSKSDYESVTGLNVSQQSLPDASSTATTATGSELLSSQGRSLPRDASAGPKDGPPHRDSSSPEFDLGAAIGAGKNVGRAVSTGVKSPMNFCLGLAKGFRNMPRLYNDDTVRPVEKVTDFSSGIKVAGKELGYGLLDGISGLVTQPIRGAEKEGAGGFVKGFGKGIGGLIAKPAAGFWGVPAYMMQGVHAEVSKLFTRSVQNYIITTRVVQGQQDFTKASVTEKAEIIQGWTNLKSDLKSFYNVKRKEKTTAILNAGSDGQISSEPTSPQPQAGGMNTHRQALTGRRGLRAQKDFFGQNYVASTQASAPVNSSSSSSRPSMSDDSAYEQAIQSSVRETSRGNAEEDAAIETAIRQSVGAMRQDGGLSASISKDPASDSLNIFEDEDMQITDEDYQLLIEKAVQQSLVNHMADTQYPREYGFAHSSSAQSQRPSAAGMSTESQSMHNDEEAALQRALQESKRQTAAPLQNVGGRHADDDGELERAIAASKEDMERRATQHSEEEIVLNYVMKQSLAEDEFRRRASSGKGKVKDSEAPRDAVQGDEDDEDLKKALEESLRLHSGAEGASSGLKAP
ncbi:hypothetical protein HIM_03252 [Hirsutella minnesotensis 3608]|nr:hypothetical protein HIM_03252 [Hirsutella minnesotensis 3608]